MIKKALTLGALLSTVCAGSTLAHSTYYKSGFLAGAHVGIPNGSGSFNSNFDTNQAGAQASSAGRARKTSALFGILAGYRHILNDGLTAGIDISGDIYSRNELNKQLTHTTLGIGFPFKNTLSRRYSVIPGINLGKVFCGRWHVALGLGVAFSGFKHEITNLTPVGGQIKRASALTRKIGFVPSLGVEYAATQNISVVGKISYEIYSKISKKFGDQLTAPALVGASYSSSISPRYLTLKVGAVYRF